MANSKKDNPTKILVHYVFIFVGVCIRYSSELYIMLPTISHPFQAIFLSTIPVVATESCPKE